MANRDTVVFFPFVLLQEVSQFSYLLLMEEDWGFFFNCELHFGLKYLLVWNHEYSDHGNNLLTVSLICSFIFYTVTFKEQSCDCAESLSWDRSTPWRRCHLFPHNQRHAVHCIIYSRSKAPCSTLHYWKAAGLLGVRDHLPWGVTGAVSLCFMTHFWCCLSTFDKTWSEDASRECVLCLKMIKASIFKTLIGHSLMKGLCVLLLTGPHGSLMTHVCAFSYWLAVFGGEWPTFFLVNYEFLIASTAVSQQ